MDTKTNQMFVNVVLDRSGSMSSTQAGTISGYNEYINGLRADMASEYSVSLIQFDTSGSLRGAELTISYEDKPLSDVPDLTTETYQPRGGTPLYDAIGECVRRVDAKGRAITVVIITDGEENSSQEFKKDDIKALIKSKEAEGWTFVFIGADIDSYAVGGSLGTTVGATANYTKGMETALYANLAQSTVTRSHGNATMGMHATQMTAFFDDTQKCAMGDTTVTGGQQAGPSTFQPGIAFTSGYIAPIATPPVGNGPAKPKRTWATTTSDSK